MDIITLLLLRILNTISAELSDTRMIDPMLYSSTQRIIDSFIKDLFKIATNPDD